MEISDFYCDYKDISANNPPIKDQNGDICALIKIENTQKGFTFDVGLLGVVKTEYRTGEIWLYVPHGVKRITISHPTLGMLRDYDLGLSVKSAATYILKLKTKNLDNQIKDYSKSKTLELNIFPKDAKVIINGVIENITKEGKITKNLSLGYYKYYIYHPDYHSNEGIIEISEHKEKHILNINLKQNFGYLNIKNDIKFNGATVIVNDSSNIGHLPINKKINLKSGNHKITIYKKYYKPYVTTVNVQDGKDLTITPNFVANYANGEIIAEQDCEIYLDGEFLSKSSWKGLIELGEHKIECKKERHRSTTKIIKLSSLNPVKYTCEPPLPIYGSINISSDPINAEIKLNGEKIGVTPLNRANVLIGTYDIEISKQGYKSEKQQITVKENETSTLYKILSTYCNFTLSSVPSMATVYINDVYKGTTPIYINEKIGKYNIELKYSGYKDYSKNMTLDDSTTDQTIKLKKQFFYPNEFYMNFNGRIMGLSGIELGLGGYIKNFNMETSYIISFDKSDFIRFPNYLDEYFQYQYKYQGFGLRLGYGIICGSRIRTTSQIGVNLIKLVEYNIDNTRTNISYIGVTGVVATKISCALGRMFSLEFSPEYSFILGGSTRYKLATNISEKMKHSTSGFTIKVGFNIFFSM